VRLRCCPLVRAQPLAPLHRTVVPSPMLSSNPESAILFADVCGSVALYDQLGDEQALALISEGLELLSEVVAEQSGEVVKTIGDELMCAFPSAENAVRAAMQMMARLRDGEVTEGAQITFKVGMDFGGVIHRGNDVFGDAVNLAARMVSLANENQLILPGGMVEHLPDDLQRQCRLLGPIHVKGKQEAIAVHEVVWEYSDDATVLGESKFTAEQGGHRLQLRYGDLLCTVSEDRPTIRVGRSEESDLVVLNPVASRNHLLVELQGDNFVVRDRSTNGTYIGDAADGNGQRLHRDHQILVGSGWISLGKSRSEPQFTIFYEVD